MSVLSFENCASEASGHVPFVEVEDLNLNLIAQPFDNTDTTVRVPKSDRGDRRLYNCYTVSQMRRQHELALNWLQIKEKCKLACSGIALKLSVSFRFIYAGFGLKVCSYITRWYYTKRSNKTLKCHVMTDNIQGFYHK